MKKIIILSFLLIANCTINDHNYVDKEIVKIQSNMSPSIAKIAGESSAGLLFLVFDIYGYLNFNLNSEEVDLHTDATFLALNYGNNGEIFFWHSNKRMSSGKVKIIASYYRNKNYCRIIQSLISLNGSNQHKTFNICLENKNWIYY